MYLVIIGWLYVTVLMAVAEANAANGTLLGAIVTFVLYGLLPMGILGYILGTPGRKRALRARQLAEQQAHGRAQAGASAAGGALQPDAGSEAPAAAEPGRVPPVRKEP